MDNIYMKMKAIKPSFAPDIKEKSDVQVTAHRDKFL